MLLRVKKTMENKPLREDVLNHIEGSPAAVAVHDKQAWISLFAKENIVEDPVGSTPHCSDMSDRKTGEDNTTPLERFYEAFIAASDIKFHVKQDIVSGYTAIRDLAIEIEMAAGLTVHVPMHAVYELTDEDGKLKICHLWAHWELSAMVMQVISNGFSGIYAMTKLGGRVMKFQGIKETLGFAKGFLGIYQKGKNHVRNFVKATNEKDQKQLSNLFCLNNTGIEIPALGSTFSPESFIDDVGLRLSVTKELSAGYTTTVSFEANYKDCRYKGFGRFFFDLKTKKIKKAQLLWDEGTVNEH
jgi:hypothetical protein